MIEKVRPLFDMPLVNVTRSFISKLNDKLVEKHGHRTSGYVLSILSVAFEHGIERELVASNPVKGVARPRKPTRDPEDIADEAAKPHQVEDEETNQPWTDEEWAFALNNAPLQLQVTILLAGLLGMRRKEIVGLRPGSWDRAKGTIRRRSAKGRANASSSSASIIPWMKCRTWSRTIDSIGSNQSSQSWVLVSVPECATVGCVVGLSMAWSPSALPTPKSFGFRNPETTPLSIPTNPATPPCLQVEQVSG